MPDSWDSNAWGAAKPDAAFHDPFEKLITKDNKQPYTSVAVSASKGVQTDGQIRGTAVLEPGVVGQALRLSGDTRVIYTNLSNLNLLGGEVSFDVKLNFDPTAKNDKTRTVLRNQILLGFQAPGHGWFWVYTLPEGYHRSGAQHRTQHDPGEGSAVRLARG